MRNVAFFESLNVAVVLDDPPERNCETNLPDTLLNG